MNNEGVLLAELIHLHKLQVSGLNKRIAELEANQLVSVTERLPVCESGCWSAPVIAVCDAGLVYRSSYMCNAHYEGCWQRTQSFINNASKRVMYWMPLLIPEDEGKS
jgi:hypothetical protein